MSLVKSAKRFQGTVDLFISPVFPRLFFKNKLPKPEGKFLVGTTYLSFTDKTRKGIYTESGEERELAVQVWYPADSIEGKDVLCYMPKEVSRLLAKSMSAPPWIYSPFAGIKTNSYYNAPLLSGNEQFPVLIFSHGYTLMAGQNTILMEELASHGYVVFSLSHTYETCASIFPDGRIIPFKAEQMNILKEEGIKVTKEYDGDQNSNAFIEYMVKNAVAVRKGVQVWSEDTIFVTNQIEKMNLGEIGDTFKGRLDMDKLGIFGHSFGGATAGQVCSFDTRFKAFVNLDGYPYGDVINRKLSQPFMVLSSISVQNNISAGYHPEQTGYMIVGIEGCEHLDFTDFTVLLPALKKLDMPGALGTIKGERQVRILKDYILSFFNKKLKGGEEPLIDQKLVKYPEVKIEIK